MNLLRKTLGGKRILPIFLIMLLLVASPNIVQHGDAASNGLIISTQSTLAQGQTIDLTATICPSPYVFSTITETVNYTGPSGQVIIKTEQQSPYGQTDYCTNPIQIDTSTFFNSTGSWQVQAQAQWLDNNDVQHTLNSNVFSFNVVQQTATSSSTSSTSSNSFSSSSSWS